MKTSLRLSPMRRQSGAALVVVLLLLLVMTILGVASMRGVLLEERMAANMLDRSYAFQAAEFALREGEARASDPQTLVDIRALSSSCADGLCSRPNPANAAENARWLAAGFWDNAANYTESGAVLAGPAADARARYTIELIDEGLPPVGSCTTSIDLSPGAGCSGTDTRYRITARSGSEGRAEVILQSMYTVP